MAQWRKNSVTALRKLITGKDSLEMVSSARCAKILVTDFLRLMRVPSSIGLRKGRCRGICVVF
jgi:hypothetical protein